MRPFVRPLIALAIPFVLAIALLAGCGAPASSPTAGTSAAAVDTAAIARQAHEGYVNAINSNNLDSLMAVLTDDIVYLSPHEPVVAGKAAVRAWGKAYLDAYTIHWDKTTDEFTLAGDWAIERYSYKESDTPKAGGARLEDTGKGLNIYHHDADGKWRVARDAWNSDLPAPAK
jgi:ketosteroid isomerase-like protein